MLQSAILSLTKYLNHSSNTAKISSNTSIQKVLSEEETMFAQGSVTPCLFLDTQDEMENQIEDITMADIYPIISPVQSKDKQHHQQPKQKKNTPTGETCAH